MLEVFTADQLPARIQEAIKGGVTRLLCPKCQGGQSKEISLGVKPLPGMDGSVPLVGLKCWRNSCGWHANVMFGEGDYFRLVRQHVHEGRVFDRPLTPPGESHKLTRKYELSEADYGSRFRVCAAPPCLAMEVRGPSGDLRGHLTRTFDEPKQVMAYKQSAQPWQDWWLSDDLNYPKHPKLFIVEDQISACKIHANGAHAVALLGTNMPVDKAHEIADYCLRSLTQPVLMLDHDAFDKACKLQSKYKHIMPNMLVSCIPCDPKDMPSDELRVYLSV